MLAPSGVGGVPVTTQTKLPLEPPSPTTLTAQLETTYTLTEGGARATFLTGIEILYSQKA